MKNSINLKKDRDIYLDDILISSESKAEHNRHLREVFKRLSKAGLIMPVVILSHFTDGVVTLLS